MNRHFIRFIFISNSFLRSVHIDEAKMNEQRQQKIICVFMKSSDDEWEGKISWTGGN